MTNHPPFGRESQVQSGNAATDYLPMPCPIYGEARSTSECEKCDGDIVRCPVYGPGERKRLAEDEPEAVEVEADAGERFDPFCHTLDSGGQALCFADIRGRSVHTRELPTTGTSMTVLTCQRCRKVICPTCQEIEARLAHV